MGMSPQALASAHPERSVAKSKDTQEKLREGALREILRLRSAMAQNDSTQRLLCHCIEAASTLPTSAAKNSPGSESYYTD